MHQVSQSGLDPAAERPGGLLGGLYQGLGAGALAGSLVGLVDSVRVLRYFQGLPEQAWTPSTPLTLWDLAPNAAGAMALYGVVFALLGAVTVLLGWPLLRRRPAAFGRSVVFALNAGAAIAVLAFWATRERYFPGLPVTSPQRIGVAAAMAGGGLLGGLILSWPVGRLGAGAWRGVLAAVLLVWAIGGAFIWTQGRSAAERGTLNEGNSDLPNVLFVIVDALRPNEVGAYGNTSVKTPNMDRLAAGGVLFERALVQAPYTWTSFGSFFTGKYPRRHGLIRMEAGERLRQNLTYQKYLKVGTRTDGRVMQNDDIAGAAFMTGALSHGSGLAEGFDGYVELMKGHPFVQLDSRWSLFRSVLAVHGALEKLRQRLDPDRLANLVLDWIEEHEGRRWSAFMHIYSTHTPYDPPEPFRSMYVDPNYDGPIQAFYSAHRQMIERGEYVPTDADIQQIYNLYLAGVTEADHQIGRVMAELERQGVLDNTLVILSSDHGEDFGEGGRWEHNHMYNSNLHVPLILHWPKGLPAGVRVEATVEAIDFFPTLVDLLGFEPPPQRDVWEKLDGVSLMPLIRGEVNRIRDYFFAEDSTFVAIQDERTMLVLERYAVKPDGWRIALEEGIGAIRMHDLRADPLQRRELFQEIVFHRPDASESPERIAHWQERRRKVLEEAERLRAVLLAWNEDMPIDVEAVVRSARDLETEAAQQELNQRAAADEELRRRLDALGYSGMDIYQGALRERVQEERARLLREERRATR